MHLSQLNKRFFSPLLMVWLGITGLSIHPLQAQVVTPAKKTTADPYHATYDNSTLTRNELPVLMPYNRIIHPAGSVLRYGDPNLENHSLDLKRIPGTWLVAVEDRYGISVIDYRQKKLLASWTYTGTIYKGFMSTYSGIEVIQRGKDTRIFWSAAQSGQKRSAVFEAVWNGKSLEIKDTIGFASIAPAPLALPNEVAVHTEGGIPYLYVVLNGNNTLEKIDLTNKQRVWTMPTGVAPYGITIVNGHVYVSNWGGTLPASGAAAETAGVPYGKMFIDPATGAASGGSVSVFTTGGSLAKEIAVGLHPNDLVASPDGQFVYVANGNSDAVSVISTTDLSVAATISVKIDAATGFIGDSPNALDISPDGRILYVANGMDNALAVVQLGADACSKGNGRSFVKGFIPTEAYPGGVRVIGNLLVVTNLEGEGPRISSKELSNPGREATAYSKPAYNSHYAKATLSFIPVPENQQLQRYTVDVKKLMLLFRTELSRLSPRKGVPARPMPERIGEPSVFKHVLYVIKENRTYDQVLGDMPKGNGSRNLCLYGDSVTPNQHQLARDYVLLDNYHASGKCSAEGHQWTDAAMVTDYIEKNVRAWFRSYPHVQTDAMVYNQKGFIWNNAADHGKSVRIYGEAALPDMDKKLTWTDIYTKYKNGEPLEFKNVTTISRVGPWLSPNYPASDELKITDQYRADAFIKELNAYEAMPGDSLPELMVMALSTDHTVGTRPGMPTPGAMIADNDLALGRIIEALSKSRFWKNTVVFVTEDDSQAGWDHVSAYRTTGFVVSPYSRTGKTISVNYNQTSMVRSIEQILGIPPMNLMDATARPMFECFSNSPALTPFLAKANLIPLDEMNVPLTTLKGRALEFAKQSMRKEYDHIDGGNDDVLNRILWFAAKGHQQYPAHLAGRQEKDEDDD
ncbi:bifunctional YncE family protein/alkaline phosphatase family protein [Niabella sp.]|uniref:bifunctional YncE family protein/alkaline phosphatase family protein n=1 Tax=Niabella sp. TaxID=1962976 RepID=UPI0026141D5F|nr:bifunctional YncE family protein/alkaline phosphatase family protein [Niabella sp.]